MKAVKRLILPAVRFWGRHFPESLLKVRYRFRFGKWPNLKHPRNLNEKILFLLLKTDTTAWTDLADKYRVRDYVEQKVGKERLVELLGVWQDANEIDFDAFPQQFVLKTNHGSGEVVIVKDKSTLDRAATVAYLNREMSRPYGEVEGGRHYSRIKPVVVAEALMVNDEESQRFSSSIIDYKCWCFNGRCEYIFVCTNRAKSHVDVLLYDRNWNVCRQYSAFSPHYKEGPELPRPENLAEMIEVAEALAAPFPCVRVDLYNTGGRIYFGEMTFTSLGGLMDYFTPEFLDKAGDMIDLSYGADALTR